MKYNDKGDSVRDIQKALIAKGYQLPEYGADGHLGEETWDALEQFAKDQGLIWAPMVHPHVVEELVRSTIPATMPPPAIGLESAHVRIIDLREVQDDPPVIIRNDKRVHKHKLTRSGRVVRRSPQAVNSVTIHQTAVKFSPRRHDRARWPNDPQRALAERSLEVACHAMSFHDGFVAVPNPLDWFVYHGNGFNSTDLGLEIDGLYPGVEADRTDAHTELTDASILAARAALRFLVEEGREMGMPIEYVKAHRQSSPTRRADPGEALWQLVVLDYGVPVLGLKTLNDLAIESTSRKAPGYGRPIPMEWDPAASEAY